MRHPHWKKFPVHTYSHHQKTVVLDYGTKHVQVHILSHARTRMHARTASDNLHGCGVGGETHRHCSVESISA
jgi:hypothetical protein